MTKDKDTNCIPKAKTNASYEDLPRKTTKHNKKLEFSEEETVRLILWAQKEWFCYWDSAISA